jgi:N-acetylmuramoyl-L-alanine amidase
VLVLGAAFFFAAPARAAEPRAAPARPAGGVRLAGVEYVAAPAFGARHGLKATTSNSGRTLVLKSAWHSVELESDTRECAIDGQRVFLGEPVRTHQDELHLSRIDAERLLAPILSPGTGEARVPGLKVIALDPGHGGKDAGKSNDRYGINEKTMALDTALRVKKLLEAAGYKVVMTRTDDRQLAPDKATDFQRRAEVATRAKADLFLSLHYNSVATRPESVTGVEIYTMTPQSQFSTADNRNDDGMVKVLNPGNENDHWNALLGYFVHREMLRGLQVSDRGLKRARWAVLRLVECPAILVESGYLSNNGEARKIATPEYRQKIAESIADGVAAYANALEGLRRRRAAEKR